MSAWTERGARVGHLCDLAGSLVRQGKHGRALDVIEQARVLALPHCLDPEGDYREGLMAAGVTLDDMDTAVAAISRGEHPPTSLPGMLTQHIRDIDSNTDDCGGDVRGSYWNGRRRCSTWALELLGGEVPK